jgi:hypothetical protein
VLARDLRDRERLALEAGPQLVRGQRAAQELDRDLLRGGEVACTSVANTTTPVPPSPTIFSMR